MSRFGTIPPEPPRIATLEPLAPAVRRAVLLVQADVERETGARPRVYETLRTDMRQAFLHGFGRTYDDGRGKVTQVKSAHTGWHFYGCAADLIHPTRAWNAPEDWWLVLGEAAIRHGLGWGGDWPMRDLPHVQWGRCRISPSPRAAELFAQGGYPAVWAAVGAM